MSQPDDTTWEAISKKLQQEKKADLLLLLRELIQVSPDVWHFVQTRYGPPENTAGRIIPYRQSIQEQFTISDWNNSVTWNFAGVHQAIDAYAQSSRGDAAGVGELHLWALEAAIQFADTLNLQDSDFEGGLLDLAESLIAHVQRHPQLHALYRRRIQAVQRTGHRLGYEDLAELLEDFHAGG